MAENEPSAQKVLLVDVDNKYRENTRRGKRFPNLALMKISAWEKAQGNEVGFEISDPDRTYISCVFPRNRPPARRGEAGMKPKRVTVVDKPSKCFGKHSRRDFRCIGCMVSESCLSEKEDGCHI